MGWVIDFLKKTGVPSNIPVTVKGHINDLKNSVRFSADISLAEAKYKVYSFIVEIERRDSSTNAYKLHDLTNQITTKDCSSDLHVPNTLIGPSINSASNIVFNFTDLEAYKITYTCIIEDTSNSNVNSNKYHFYYIQNFRYVASLTLNDFSFNQNVGVGDDITISGLTLNYGSNVSLPLDLTAPEGDDAMEITFQEAELSPELSSGTSNTEYNEVFTKFLPFSPTGSYTLVGNTLTNGKVYRVQATARWEHGYSTSIRSTKSLYVIDRPVISGVSAKPLYVANSNDVVTTIDVNKMFPSGSFVVPSKIWFEYYDKSPTPVKVAVVGGDFNSGGLNLVNLSPVNLYSLKLSDIVRESGTNGIENGKEYTVRARTRYEGDANLPDTPQFRFSNPFDTSFGLVKPVITNNKITAYDVQDEGGDSNTSSQLIATISVDVAQYKLYAPNGPNGIKFNIYDESGTTLIAKTDAREFLNTSTNTKDDYNILLGDLNIVSGQSDLVNGTLYKVKAEVTLENHKGDTETRESAIFTDVIFSQNVAPVVDLTAGNTWALASSNDPNTNNTLFNRSPKIGVSGHFRKNNQFNNGYTKHLDISTTKFKLEYRKQTSNIWSAWTDVKKAVLIQRSDQETLAQAVIRARELTPETKSDGKYDNVIGTGIGNLQKEMVFFIPHEQESDTFTESNKVEIRVTVIDTAQIWTGAPGVPVIYEASSDSNTVQLINRIVTYSYTNDTSTEPYNIQHNAHYTNSTLHVDVNGTIVTTSLSNVLADSNQITSVVNGGLKVVNTGVGNDGAASGKLPKVNLYTYGNTVPDASQTTSNSVTVSQINGLGAYYIIDQQPTALEYPFIVIYTTPTSSGVNHGWFKSKLYYAPSLSGNTVLDSSKVGLTLIYTGNDDSSFRSDIPSHRRVKCNLLPMVPNDLNSLTLSNEDYANEFVKSVTIQTSSNATTSQAGSFKFTLSEAGLKTSSSVLPYIVMRFTLKLSLNIPVDWESKHGHSVIVNSGYASNNLNTNTTVYYSNPPATKEVVTVYVNPNSGTTIHYNVAYVVNNVNLPSSPKTTQGVTSTTDSVQNKFFPEASDYSITDVSYNTFNTGGESRISFTPSFAPLASTNRIDGLNVYFRSPNTIISPNNNNVGSNIDPIRIGTILSTATGNKIFRLLHDPNVNPSPVNNADTLNFTPLNYMDASRPVTITTTYGVGPNDIPNTDIVFSILDSDNQAVIFSSVTKVLNVDPNNKTITGEINSQVVNQVTFNAGTWTNSNVAQLGGSGAPTLEASSNYSNQLGSWSLSKATWVSTTSSGNQRTATYTGGIFTKNDFSKIWGDFDLAYISFKAYRDRRVTSANARYNSLNYVESGLDTTSFNKTIWNVPKLNSPSNNGDVTLCGGVRNSNTPTSLNWIQTHDPNDINFKYDLTVQKENDTAINFNNHVGNTKGLNIDLTTDAKYTVTLRTLFDGPNSNNSIREVSTPVDTITFYTIYVDVSGVDIRVQDPSDTQKVNLSWNEAKIYGRSVTQNGGSEPSSFSINIDDQFVKYLARNPEQSLTRLNQDPLANRIERIVSPATTKEYTLPNSALGRLYEFYMFYGAFINYKVNNTIIKTECVEIAQQTTKTLYSQYIVSTIPSIVLPSTTPVILTGETNPTLLLTLNANGLEDEGFISVVVVLTQDGTANNPEGEQALLVFPDTSANFIYTNALLGSGAGNPPYRLTGGESAISAPRNLTSSSISTHNNNYTLRIGTVGANKRFGHSALSMPPSAISGFVSSGSPSSSTYNPINYMVIATTRRGTDIEVGKFEYQSVPYISNVNVTTSNGQFFINFNANPS